MIDVPRSAISLTQPWATLMVTGAKRVETRSWRTAVRGLVGIHAAKGFPRWAVKLCFEEPFKSVLKAVGIEKPADLPRGALLGAVEIVDCVPTEGLELVGISGTERAFGDYGPGRFAFLTVRPLVFSEPVPMRGSLGIWDVRKAVAA